MSIDQPKQNLCIGPFVRIGGRYLSDQCPFWLFFGQVEIVLESRTLRFVVIYVQYFDVDMRSTI